MFHASSQQKILRAAWKKFQRNSKILETFRKVNSHLGFWSRSDEFICHWGGKGFSERFHEIFDDLVLRKDVQDSLERMPAFVSYHRQAGLEHRMNAFLFLNQIEETKIYWAGRNFSGFNEIFLRKLDAFISIARLGPFSKARKKNSMCHGNDLLRFKPKKILPPLFVCGNDKSVSLPHIAGENKFFPRWRYKSCLGCEE